MNMADEPKPKYEMHELMILKVVNDYGSAAVTPSTVAATLMTSGSRTPFSEDGCRVLLRRIESKGGVKAQGDDAYKITPEGTTDLGPVLNRSISDWETFDEDVVLRTAEGI